MLLKAIVQTAVLFSTTTLAESRSEGSGHFARSVESISKIDESHDLRHLLPKECGLRRRRNRIRRVAHGHQADPYDYPWMVALIYNTSRGKKRKCSGSLITDKHVLTAAHCLTKNQPEDVQMLYARLGDWNIKTKVDCISENECRPQHMDVSIEEEIPHELYTSIASPFELHNDVALLKLAERVNFTYEVGPICLPKTPNIPDYMTLVGWGLTEHGNYSDVLMEVSLPSVSLKDCRAMSARNGLGHMTMNQICTGAESGKDMCLGDSGGPLMTTSEDENNVPRSLLMGVISYKMDLLHCPSQMPSVFPKIHNYIPWILRKISSTSATEDSEGDDNFTSGTDGSKV